MLCKFCTEEFLGYFGQAKVNNSCAVKGNKSDLITYKYKFFKFSIQKTRKRLIREEGV